MNARREDFWRQFENGDDGLGEDVANYVERNPDTTPAAVLAKFGLDLDQRDAVRDLIESARDVDETDAGDVEREPADDGDAPETRVGHTQADDVDVYIGRTTTSGRVRHLNNTKPTERGWLGNPYVLDEHATDRHRDQADVFVVATREISIRRYAEDLLDAVERRPELRRALYEHVRGGVVGGWCRTLDVDEPACHGDVVASVADRIEKRVPVTDGGRRWPTNKIGPCAACGRTLPLAEIDGRAVCRECSGGSL